MFDVLPVYITIYCDLIVLRKMNWEDWLTLGLVKNKAEVNFGARVSVINLLSNWGEKIIVCVLFSTHARLNCHLKMRETVVTDQDGLVPCFAQEEAHPTPMPFCLLWLCGHTQVRPIVTRPLNFLLLHHSAVYTF